jgi:hypothetical protein
VEAVFSSMLAQGVPFQKIPDASGSWIKNGAIQLINAYIDENNFHRVAINPLFFFSFYFC